MPLDQIFYSNKPMTTEALAYVDGLFRTLDVPEPDRHRMALRLLQEGRARLAQPGVWIKGSDRVACAPVPGGYLFCARGVLLWLAERLQLGGGLHDAMLSLARQAPNKSDTMRLHYSEPHSVIAWVNDQPETKLGDVLAWFDRTIVHLEAVGA